MDDNEVKRSHNKKGNFLLIMRYISVALATVWLFVLMIASMAPDDLMFLLVLVFALISFIITIPIIGFWIYSFIKAIPLHTKADKVLMCFHIADIFMLGISMYCGYKLIHRCDAFIMADFCRGENGYWMRHVARSYRDMLPDSTRLSVEFETFGIPQSDILSEEEMKRLKEKIEDYCSCIGLDVDNYSNSGYVTLRFRRVGMGMYSYRLYDKPLTREQQDSLNSDCTLIVYNDSTVFVYGSGAFGDMSFPGKKEFLERNKK